MKKILFFLFISFPVTGFAQGSQIDDFFEKFSDKEGYTVITFTKEMFELYSNKGNSRQDKDSANVSGAITLMKMLTVNSDTKKSESFSKELQSVLPQNKYKKLMEIKEAGSNITFLIRQEGNRIKEFIMTIDGASPMLIYIKGDMDLDQLSKLSDSMDIEGFDKLDKINEEK